MKKANSTRIHNDDDDATIVLFDAEIKYGILKSQDDNGIWVCLDSIHYEICWLVSKA